MNESHIIKISLCANSNVQIFSEHSPPVFGGHEATGPRGCFVLPFITIIALPIEIHTTPLTGLKQCDASDAYAWNAIFLTSKLFEQNAMLELLYDRVEMRPVGTAR